MPRLRLVDDGYPFKKIMQGSKWIGRVYKNAQGLWVGQIGKNASRIEVTAASPAEAFNEVAARFFGQPNAAALAAHNSAVRSTNRQRRTVRANAMDEVLRSLERVLGGSAARGRALRNDGLSNEALQAQVDAERERRQRAAAQEQESNEDDFVPPVGRRH